MSGKKDKTTIHPHVLLEYKNGTCTARIVIPKRNQVSALCTTRKELRRVLDEYLSSKWFTRAAHRAFCVFIDEMTDMPLEQPAEIPLEQPVGISRWDDCEGMIDRDQYQVRS